MVGVSIMPVYVNFEKSFIGGAYDIFSRQFEDSS